MTKRTIFVSSHAITDRIRLMIRQLDGILALSIQEASEMVLFLCLFGLKFNISFKPHFFFL